jgi:SAM-dependent methyltransferase
MLAYQEIEAGIVRVVDERRVRMPRQTSWTSEIEELEAWDALLRCQAEMTIPLELPHYFMSRRWQEVSHVVDLGSGMGHYLNQLARAFPSKRYTGVDSNAAYIALAKERYPQEGPGGISFRTQDLFEVSGPVPCIIARLVAQHLPSLPRFLSKVRELLENGGLFISVEPNDQLRIFEPPMPGLLELYSAFEEEQLRLGLHRDAALRMARLAPAHGFSLDYEADVAVPSTLPGYRALFLEFQRLILTIFRKEFEVPAAYDRLDADLARWQATPNAFAQIGVRMTLYRAQ